MANFLIVGLGNIGLKYVNTRHNIGFCAITTLLATFKGQKYLHHCPGQVFVYKFCKHTYYFAMPTTYMNLSGLFVRCFCQSYKIITDHLVVIYDDIAYPVGTIRIKKQGSAGGHKGMNDIICKMQTNVFWRIRFGIGQPIQKNLADHVLSDFSSSEQIAKNKGLKKIQDLFLA